MIIRLWIFRVDIMLHARRCVAHGRLCRRFTARATAKRGPRDFYACAHRRRADRYAGVAPVYGPVCMFCGANDSHSLYTNAHPRVHLTPRLPPFPRCNFFAWCYGAAASPSRSPSPEVRHTVPVYLLAENYGRGRSPYYVAQVRQCGRMAVCVRCGCEKAVEQ